MFSIIPYIFIGASFTGLAVVVLRKIPVLANLSDEEIAILANKKGFIRKCREINFRQYFLNFIIRLEKFLRKVKIIFLKIENLLSKWICFLGEQSRVMTHKSKEWIKQRERKRWKQKHHAFEKNGKSDDTNNLQVDDVAENETIFYPVGSKNEKENEKEESELLLKHEQEKSALPISELEKPIKEEQKWINLIVENPKNITAYKFLGFLYWKQHNYTDAKASLEMAVKLGSCDKKVKEIIGKINEMEIGKNIVNSEKSEDIVN